MDIAPHWNANDYVFTFPTGATLRFGYLKTDADIANYDGDEYHFISFDEQTQFTEKQYTDLSARLRKQKGDPIPLRRWNASNPGNIGHTWVRDMYVKGDEYFIPSTYKDNPYIDDVEYEISLNKLDHIRRKQLLDGNWDINPTGGLFKNEWFSKVNQNHLGGRRVISRVRFWDLAGTIPSETNPDPDWTVGLLMWKDNQGDIYIVNVKRFRKSPGAIEDEILNTARNDGANTTVVIEQEGGGASKIAMEYIRKKLAGFTVHTDKPKESKYDRARPVSSHAEHHNIYVLAYDLKGNQYRWVQMSLEEIESFPSPGVHDDVPDAMSGAFKWCNKANTDIDWGWFDAE